MIRRRGPAARLGLAAAAGVLLAACSSGGGDDPTLGPPATATTSTPTPTPAPPAVPVRVGGGRTVTVTLRVGQSAQLVVASPPGPTSTAVRSGEGVVALTPDGLRALRPGTARVEVVERPACTPGGACSHLVVLLGQVAVTVTP